MPNKKGFTLLEAVIGSALFIIVMFAVMDLVIISVRDTTTLLSTQGAKEEVELVLTELRRDLFNTALLSPEESLITSGDNGYKGIASFDNASYHSLCKYEEDPNNSARDLKSILRFTYIWRKKHPEEVLKAWNITDSVNDLRISYSPGIHHMFKPGNYDGIKELLVIDIDGLVRGRFKISSAPVHMNSPSIDPYTLLPGTTPPYPPWTQLQVEMPKMASGSAQTPVDQNFISNSIVYPLKTVTVCVSATENKIIQIDEADGSVLTLFDGEPFQMDIDRFEVSYLNSVKTARVDSVDFFKFPASDPTKRRCINMYRLAVDLKKRKVASGGKDMKFRKMGILNSFNLHRPANCEP